MLEDYSAPEQERESASQSMRTVATTKIRLLGAPASAVLARYWARWPDTTFAIR